MLTDNDLPSLLDGALSAARTCQDEVACALMREVLRHASSLPPDAIVEGPQALPAGFHLNAAEAFLHIHCHFSDNVARGRAASESPRATLRRRGGAA